MPMNPTPRRLLGGVSAAQIREGRMKGMAATALMTFLRVGFMVFTCVSG